MRRFIDDQHQFARSEHAIENVSGRDAAHLELLFFVLSCTNPLHARAVEFELHPDFVADQPDRLVEEIVSEFELPLRQTGGPMTYMVNGKQYIVVAVGDRNEPAELVALTLP